MLRLEWTIIALSHAVDQTSSALSIFNILESIRVPPEVPEPTEGSTFGLPFQFCIIQLWSREPATPPQRAQAKIRIVAPNGVELTSVPFIVDLQSASHGRTVVSAAGFPYNGIGVYRFECEIFDEEEWKPMGTTNITVMHSETPRSTQAA